jgi:hypothetical protein
MCIVPGGSQRVQEDLQGRPLCDLTPWERPLTLIASHCKHLEGESSRDTLGATGSWLFMRVPRMSLIPEDESAMQLLPPISALLMRSLN